MIRSLAPIAALCTLMPLTMGCGAAPASPTVPSTTGTTAPAPTNGSVAGIVRHEAFVSGRILVPEGPLAGAEVTVTEGAGAGRSVTTGADGAYRLELPPGPFRVRWSAPTYEPRASDSGTITAGITTTMMPVTLRLLSNVPIPEWSVSGIVRDGVGNPLPGALVTAGDIFYPAAGASTDAAGGFRITSTRQHPD